MLSKAKKFLATDAGAVTVDWVVLCAAVVVLGGATILSMTDNTVDVADSVMKFTPGGF